MTQVVSARMVVVLLASGAIRLASIALLEVGVKVNA